jgi:hypothetical protein
MAVDTSAQATTALAAKKAKPARKPIAAKRSTAEAAAKPASKRPAEEITSKADLIRKVAGIIKAKGEKPRPTEIVKILKEEGVTVAPAQVSMTLKAAGYRPLRKRRKGKKTAGEIAAKQAAGAGRSSLVSIDDLLAAKSVAGAFGGTDKAIAALQALKRLQG